MDKVLESNGTISPNGSQEMHYISIFLPAKQYHEARFG